MAKNTAVTFISTSEFYKVPTFLLRFVCVRRGVNNKVCLLNFNASFWCDIIPLICLSLLQVAFNVHLIVADFDLEEFCYAQSCIAYQMTAFSKILSLAISSSKLKEMLSVLNEIHPTSAEKQSVYKIPEWLRRTKRLMLRYSFIQIFMITTYVVLPFYSYVTVFLATGVWKMEFPLKFWLPFDTDKPPVFYTVYMLQSWLGFSASLYLSSSDLLLLAIIHLVCIHFDYIHRRFHELQPQSNAVDQLATIRDCISKQNTIIE